MSSSSHAFQPGSSRDDRLELRGSHFRFLHHQQAFGVSLQSDQRRLECNDRRRSHFEQACDRWARACRHNWSSWSCWPNWPCGSTRSPRNPGSARCDWTTRQYRSSGGPWNERICQHSSCLGVVQLQSDISLHSWQRACCPIHDR